MKHMKLAETKKGFEGQVTAVSGNHHVLSQLIGIGIVEGSRIRVIQNEKKQPVLFYCRDSVIALGKKDCEGIEVEGGVQA